MTELLKMIGLSLFAGIITGAVCFSLAMLARAVGKYFFVFSFVALLVIAILSANIKALLYGVLVIVMMAVNLTVATFGVVIALSIINWIGEKWLDL